jgi:D-sedoheptulose 7-phosphate isomerase
MAPTETENAEMSTLTEHLRTTSGVLARMADQVGPAQEFAEKLCRALQSGKKLVTMGNGGSAADAQHFAAELVCRFEKERPALPAIALSTDTSVMTAIGNDYAYDQIFARQVQALVQPGDIVLGISTSGNSQNVLAGIAEAKRKKAFTVGLTGGSGGKLKDAVDLCICVPSPRTAHIQECHIALIHGICTLVDEATLAAIA